MAKDGLPVKVVINFVRLSERDKLLPLLQAEAKYFPHITSTFADPSVYRQFLSKFEYPSTAKRLCFLSTFITIGYTECETLDAFVNNGVTFKYIPTPRELYGYAIEVNEIGFHELLRHGPVFIEFDLRGCETCNKRADAARQAAIRVSQFGSRTNWCVWDIEQSPASFADQIDIPMPSLWYFPSEKISDAIIYNGRADLISIIRWAYGQTKDFNLVALLQHESELAQQ
jgi:hypothetical protein